MVTRQCHQSKQTATWGYLRCMLPQRWNNLRQLVLTAMTFRSYEYWYICCAIWFGLYIAGFWVFLCCEHNRRRFYPTWVVSGPWQKMEGCRYNDKDFYLIIKFTIVYYCIAQYLEQSPTYEVIWGHAGLIIHAHYQSKQTTAAPMRTSKVHADYCDQ